MELLQAGRSVQHFLNCLELSLNSPSQGPVLLSVGLQVLPQLQSRLPLVFGACVLFQHFLSFADLGLCDVFWHHIAHQELEVGVVRDGFELGKGSLETGFEALKLGLGAKDLVLDPLLLREEDLLLLTELGQRLEFDDVISLFHPGASSLTASSPAPKHAFLAVLRGANLALEAQSQVLSGTRSQWGI